MRADFKNESKVMITGADKSQAILIERLIELATDVTKEIKLVVIPDIEGDTYGFSLEVTDKVVQG